MADNVGKYVEEINSFYNEVSESLNHPEGASGAARVTQAVLHTLRDRISTEESMHLIAQLPLILKGIYVNGWNIHHKPNNSKTLNEFLSEVREHSLPTAGRDFGDDQQAQKNVSAVLKALDKYISEGEKAHLRANLPEELEVLF